MFRLASILIREMTACGGALAGAGTARSIPSTRIRTTGGAERLDVNVARPQFHGALEQIIDGPYHRRAARQIPQAFDIVVAGPMLRLVNLGSADAAFVELPLQNG